MTRQHWEQQLEPIRRDFEVAPRDHKYLKQIASIMEDNLARLHNRVRETTPPSHNRFAFFSTGGLGRRELHPFSDLDLVFLFEKPLLYEDEEFLKTLLNGLWDFGLSIGHHVLHVKEYLFDPRNLELATALMDLRFLAGDAQLAEQFRTVEVQRFLGRQKKEFLKSLLAFQEERHQKYNNTIYQLEPDVKEAPGGLRDLHVSRWIGKILFGIESGQGLVDHDLLSPSRLRRLRESHYFLLSLRLALHFLNRRDRNILSHDHQESITRVFGYPGNGDPEAVRALMKDYFLRAKEIHDFYESMSRRALPPARRISKSFKSTVWSATRVRKGALEFPDPGVIRENPANLLKLFYRSAKYQIPISEAALDQVRQNLHRLHPRAGSSLEIRDLFLKLLRQPRCVHRVLVLMHETGLLGRLFPEFDRIRCHVIQDFFHRYTVDEHSLLTIKNLEDLCQSRKPRDRRFGDVLKSLGRQDLLYFAMLFHDVGKAEEGNHVVKSLEALEGIARRIALPEADTQVVRFLIHSHLEMSNAFQHRDITDESMLRSFADHVGAQENLKMLCLVTYADIKAVSPDAMTPWKEDLLWQLYVEADAHLTRDFAEDRWETHQASEPVEAALPLCPEDPTGSKLRVFLDGFPRRYLKYTPPEKIAEHFKMAERLRFADEFLLKLTRQRGGAYELSLMAFDRPFLFANLSGVLACFGMNIIRGQAFANHHGLILDVIEFEDRLQTFRLNKTEIEHFRETFRQVALGEQSLIDLLKRRESSNLFQPRGRGNVTTSVNFVEHASGKHTILEIVTRDRFGLLYTIARTISQTGCNIDVALISTEGHKAIDVFYITQEGRRLSKIQQDNLATLMRKKLGRPSVCQEAPGASSILGKD